MDRRFSLDRAGSILVVAFALITVVIVAVSAAQRLAADDLFTAVSITRGTANTEQVRTPFGRWLSAHLASDLAAEDDDAAYARAVELAYRSDRLRELAAVPRWWVFWRRC